MPVARAAALLLCAAACTSTVVAAPRFTATEMMRLGRIADVQPSPDGTRVAYALTRVDLAAGKRDSDLWVVPLAGGEPRPLVPGPSSDSRPRWSRDGQRLAFLSTRDGSPQVWTTDANGGTLQRATALTTGVDAFEWIDEARLLVQTAVFDECGADDACNSRRLAAAAKGSTARVYDELLYRHWDTWSDGRRSHLIALRLDGTGAVDLTPGNADAPPFSLGDSDWAVSPDGTEACFSRKDARDEAWSTNADVFLVPTIGGAAPAREHEPGLRRRLRLQPRRPPARVARAGARGIRVGSLAARRARAAGRCRAAAHGGARPAGRAVRVLPRLADALLRRRRGRPLARARGAGRRAARSGPCSTGPRSARSACWRTGAASWPARRA